MKSEIKTAIVLGAIIIGIVGSLSAVFSSLESTPSEAQTGQNEIKSIDKSNFKKAPQLEGISGYVNTSPEELEKQIQDKVVLYDIWTYSCINCIRTLPYITAWHEKYADEGLLIIGIHSPEFEFEKDVHNVKMAVEKYGIMYPVVLDNDKEIWKAFENHYWPRKYVADHEGYIRYDHIGEGAYAETEKIIQKLLEERAMQEGLQQDIEKALVDLEEFEHTSFRTPELYFGYEFAQGRNQLGNQEGFVPNEEVTYSIPESLQPNHFYLEGTWKNLPGSMKLVSDNGRIVLPYFAKEVNIVTANEVTISVLIDGSPIEPQYAGKDLYLSDSFLTGKLSVTQPGLYNIASSDEPSSHVIELLIENPGFEIYTFTFG